MYFYLSLQPYAVQSEPQYQAAPQYRPQYQSQPQYQPQPQYRRPQEQQQRDPQEDYDVSFDSRNKIIYYYFTFTYRAPRSMGPLVLASSVFR